jgi:hypothetical protein
MITYGNMQFSVEEQAEAQALHALACKIQGIWLLFNTELLLYVSIM